MQRALPRPIWQEKHPVAFYANGPVEYYHWQPLLFAALIKLVENEIKVAGIMITRGNYCEPFELFHRKQVVLLSEVCSVKPELNKSWQSAAPGRLFIFLS